MRKQDIEIVISPTGEVSFTVKGVKGAYEQGEEVGARNWAGEGEAGDD